MTVDPMIARLRALDICDLSDALDALGIAPAITGLIATSAARPIAGRAATVRLAAGPPPPSARLRHLCTSAVEQSGADNVIVVEQRTGIDAASWGGILSRAAKRRGVAGTIVDGPVRDVEEAIRIDYPVYARAATARTARGRLHEAAFDVQIQVGDTIVRPGDYVAADRSGCVVVPAARIADVLARAEAIFAKSEQMAAAIERGIPASEVMGGSYETMLERDDDSRGRR
jgi:regulator of RNase E activity RraA